MAGPKDARRSHGSARSAEAATDGSRAGGDGAERIAKRIARAGVASRRDAERLIEAGRVSVNGRRIESPALNVTPADRVAVDGKPLAEPEPPRLWRYHKPAGLVTTARDEQGRPTVFDRLPPEMPRVMSIGRLDLTSEGLLLLTNDGALKRRLELPATGWLRRYRVRVHGAPTDASLEPLTRGMVVDGERFQPMGVAIDRQQGANAWLTVSLREGRNREIRRAMEAVGLGVNRLIRLSYGPFQLGDLQAGAVEEVRPRVLRDQLGLAETPGGDTPRGKPKTKAARPGMRTPRRERP
ncbi:MAG: pseudouridine synthase [Pseudomonadota bacterium]